MGRSRIDAKPRNFCADGELYARQVVSGEIPACEWVRLACQRQLDDLQRKDFKWRFDEEFGNRVCRFLERLPHIKGRWKTKNIRLEPWQCFFITALFGWVDEDDLRRFRKALIVVPRKNAKALALDTPIPTPTGWTTMGELSAGDKVFDETGAVRTVLATSEVFSDHDCYEVEFSNGERVIADAGHLWETTARVNMVGVTAGRAMGSNDHPVTKRVRTTQELFETQIYGARGDRNHSLSVPGPLDLPDQPLPVDPYLLGAWLGDGHSSSAIITCGDQDKDEMAANMRSLGYSVLEHRRPVGWSLQICATEVNLLGDSVRVSKAASSNLMKRLRGLGVLNDKHIPENYLRGSSQQRLDLLRGLMDTDGTINKNGRVLSYTSTVERLARGVSELLSSLGVKHSVKANPMACNGQPVSGLAYKVQFMAFRDILPAFRLTRKLSRMRISGEASIAPRSRSVQISSVRKVPSVPTKCIAVDSPSRLFLFGRTMLPTHNSTICAGLALFLLCADGEPGAEIYSAAVTRDQAKIAWESAQKMVKRDPAMQEHFGIEALAHSIVIEHEGSTYKPLSRDADSLEGLSPHAAVIDELHAHKTREVFDVLDEATGARRQPLLFMISTEGDNSEGIFAEQVEYGERVLRGGHEDDSFFCLYYSIDKEDDWTRPETWRKANPNLGVSVFETDMEIRCRQAVANADSQASFLTKRLNVRVGAGSAYFNMLAWTTVCQDTSLKLADFYGQPCLIHLDLASKRDLTAKVYLFQRGDHYVAFGRYYLPDDVITPGSPNYDFYRGWAAKDYLTLTEGNRTDYSTVEFHAVEDMRNFQLRAVGIDPLYNAEQLTQRLKDLHGLPMQEVAHNVPTFSEPMKTLDALIVAGKIRHNGDPVLTWALGNTVAKRDAKDNVYPRKTRNDNKIDPAVALIAAMSMQLRLTDERSIYENPDTAVM